MIFLKQGQNYKKVLPNDIKFESFSISPELDLQIVKYDSGSNTIFIDEGKNGKFDVKLVFKTLKGEEILRSVKIDFDYG